jgi:hypothetical protein
MADGDDHFELDALDVGGQLVQLGLAFGAQVGLVEVEQGVGGQRYLLGGGLGRGGGRSGGGGSGRGGRFALGLGHQVLLHQPGSHSSMAIAGVQ